MHLLAKSLAVLILATGLHSLGQATAPDQQQRDLNEVPDVPARQSAPPQIPRSYALVVGISRYKNLPAKAQLQFPDRDAGDI